MKTKKPKVKEYKFIEFNDNWADEMNISGFVVMTDEKWNQVKTRLKSIKTSFSVGFGSNEDNEYNNGKQLLDRLTVKNITEDEVKILKKLFGKGYDNEVEYGNNSWIVELEDLGDEEEYDK